MKIITLTGRTSNAFFKDFMLVVNYLCYQNQHILVIGSVFELLENVLCILFSQHLR